ncbi:MAG: glycosyltransferase family 2 protein, partial [Clostridia bacterium]|nr:glycosyltransferase family 2 protein [Clostridia bacterium]
FVVCIKIVSRESLLHMNRELMDISIIIINYMTYERTLGAIKSVVKHTEGLNYEIILVDNASQNQDACRLDEYLADGNYPVILIKNEKNVGFGRGNNMAVEKSSGKYLVFFNSDCELTENTFKKCFDFMEKDNSIGAIGPRLITPDGNLDSGCKRGFPTPSASFWYFIGMHRFSRNPRFDRYKLFHLDEFKMAEVDAISGAFLFTSRKIFDDAGGFDSQFFMYGEDLDLCRSIRLLGYRILYNPEMGNVVHYRGESGKHRKFKTVFNFYEAMILFYNKHYKRKGNILVTAAVYSAVGVMFIMKSLAGIFRIRKK